MKEQRKVLAALRHTVPLQIHSGIRTHGGTLGAPAAAAIVVLVFEAISLWRSASIRPS
jgi:hypothetical protein